VVRATPAAAGDTGRLISANAGRTGGPKPAVGVRFAPHAPAAAPPCRDRPDGLDHQLRPDEHVHVRFDHILFHDRLDHDEHGPVCVAFDDHHVNHHELTANALPGVWFPFS
jgi:hypothetical protein